MLFSISFVKIDNFDMTTAKQIETACPKALIKAWIKTQALSLGFSDCGFLSVHHDLFAKSTTHLQARLSQNLHGELKFLEENHHLRANPSLLVAGAKTIISVRMDYLHELPKPRTISDNQKPNHAIIARYARGRDYHKTMRQKLKALAHLIQNELPNWQGLGVGAEDDFIFRPFSDSAPIFERPLADACGLGWTGKHTLLINRQAGSFFNLGELFISLDLVEKNTSTPVSSHCGSCNACIDVCPTKAIIAPYTVDAKACISYLTIEHKGSIDIKYRKAIGNRVFGCDDCQLICPWNRYAKISLVADYAPRHHLDNITLNQLWQWQESDFLSFTEGSPIRRAGYFGFMRNIAIALGNSKPKTQQEKQEVVALLNTKLGQNAVLDEHILWAIDEIYTDE